MKLIVKIPAFILLAGWLLNVSCKKEYSCEGNCIPNLPPIAEAGPDQKITIPKDSVNLDGSRSKDPDGIISSYTWIKISGPVSSKVVAPDSATTLVNMMVMGIYNFQLTVTDNHGLSAKDTVQIIVVDPRINQPPVAIAGNDQIIVLPVDSVVLTGSSSFDPDGTIISYLWTKLSGPLPSNILTPNAGQAKVKNLTEGIYQFQLLVTDNSGLSAKDTVQIIVNSLPATNLPVANAGPDITILLPLDSAYLNGSASVNATVFKWTYLSGPPGSYLTHPDPLYPPIDLVKGLTAGTYFFQLEVSNPGGGKSVDTMKITVLNDPGGQNIITSTNLKWRFVDEYGIGWLDMDIITTLPDNFWLAWDTVRPIEVLLQIDPGGPWIVVPSVQSGITFVYDVAKPNIWVVRVPTDSTWVGKESSLKIRLL